MKTNSPGKIIISFILIVCALWIAVPKVYVHALLGHIHSSAVKSDALGTSVQSNDAKDDDCEFDKYDSPVYFTIFKFINNLIPSRPKEQSFLNRTQPVHELYEGRNHLLRAPPMA
ncbi:MAG: hypothetical protein ACXVP0_13865 [Bacteroidia bacterium]